MEIAQTQLNHLPEHMVSKSQRANGFFVWFLILLLAVGYLLPYFLVKQFFTSVVAYGSVSLVPLCLVAYAQFVQELIDHWGIQAKQSYTIVLDIPEKLDVWASSQQLRQILRNLLSNAMKYSPLHSRIVISARCLDVNRGGTMASSDVCISVTDEGPGIPPSDVPLLFNKFVRLKRDLAGTVRGTGLGLYISKQLVQEMDGRIWIESTGKEGEGSCFCFTLPCAAMKKENEQTPAPQHAK